MEIRNLYFLNVIIFIEVYRISAKCLFVYIDTLFIQGIASRTHEICFRVQEIVSH